MEIKYRTESFSGTEVRAVRDVICYEVCELGNTDILETLANGLLKGTPYGPKVEELIMRVYQDGGTLYGYEQYPVPLDPKQWFNDFLKKGE